MCQNVHNPLNTLSKFHLPRINSLLIEYSFLVKVTLGLHQIRLENRNDLSNNRFVFLFIHRHRWSTHKIREPRSYCHLLQYCWSLLNPFLIFLKWTSTNKWIKSSNELSFCLPVEQSSAESNMCELAILLYKDSFNRSVIIMSSWKNKSEIFQMMKIIDQIKTISQV